MPAPDTISFARGAPSLDIVDVAGLKAAAQRALENDPGGALMYGTAVGYVPLRRWIAEKHGVAPENVIVTNGSMQADAFLFDELVAAGEPVIVERPTYDRTLLGLRDRGANVRPVTLEADGIATAELRGLLEDGLRPSLAHVIPNFHNPGGATLAAAKREELLALAGEHGFTIFEDDPYIDIRFAGEPLATMLDMDAGAGRVVYASSFSKTVCPGVRVGYLVGHEELISRIVRRATNTYISPSMIAQAIVYEFAAGGAMDGAVKTVKEALRERARLLAQALRAELPEARFVEPEGGYFMWVELPEGADVDTIFTAAAERGVQIVKGTDFLLEGGHNAFRLAYSGVTEDKIAEGVTRLAEAVRAASGAAAAR